MLTIEQAFEKILGVVAPLPVTQVSLADALGLVLAEEIRSDCDSPPFDKSLMDGFAVRAADVATGRADLRILERITAGMMPTRPVGPGEATQIMTGAPLPDEADAVVKIEDCEIAGGTVRIAAEPVQPGLSIIRRGTNLKQGEVVLPAGVSLRPTHIGALAEVGCARVAVRRRPKVAVLPTGDEIVPIDQTPGPGQIRNSNESLLAAQIEASGGVAVRLGIARDERKDLHAKILRGLECDVLVLSGGVSAGTLDLVPSELAAAGVRPVFHKVELKPGKPLWFGESAAPNPRCCVFGLPGNPVSTLVCFELFVRTALRRMMGVEPAQLPPIAARLKHAHRQPEDRPTYHPAKLTWSERGPEVSLIPWHGSSDLQATSAANAMAFVPGTAREYQPGDRLPTTPWSGW